jgi:hypothetical protein
MFTNDVVGYQLPGPPKLRYPRLQYQKLCKEENNTNAMEYKIISVTCILRRILLG